MLAQPILKGALCSPLMQLAAASAEPAPASCKRARPAATTGAKLDRAKTILFMSAFSVRQCHLPDPGPRQTRVDFASPAVPNRRLAYPHVSEPRFDKSTRPCLRNGIGQL